MAEAIQIEPPGQHLRRAIDAAKSAPPVYLGSFARFADPDPPKRLGAAIDVLSQSTGSVVIDAALGAAIGYWVGRGKTSYVIGGAVATGLAGVLGAALTVGVGYWRGR